MAVAPGGGREIKRQLLLFGWVVLVTLESAAAASPEEVNQACREASNLDEAVCRCVADKSGEQLSELGRAFVVESLAGSDERVAELREQMVFDELMAAGMFMTDAPSDCAGALEQGQR